MQPTATTAAPIKLPSKSRRRWYVLALLLVLIATPIAWYFIVGWQGEREMDVLLAELDAEEPGWLARSARRHGADQRRGEFRCRGLSRFAISP